MDAGHTSKRLFPAYTLEQLYQFAADAKTEAECDRFRLAIRQRESFTADYVPQFVVPQLY